MQKTAPNYAPPAAGPCPTDEELAAYIDGGLDRVERERITEHLASCESCYAIFTETARFLVESGPPTREDLQLDQKVLKFPSGSGRLAAQWGSVAALLLAGVGAGAFQFLASPPELVTSDLTAPIEGRQGLVENFWDGPTPRGSGDERDKPYLDSSFQLGVQLVNLQMTLEANDSKTAVESTIPRILQVVEAQALLGYLEAPYKELSGDLLDKPLQPATLEKAQQLAKESRGYAYETFLDFGQWVEASQLAALTQNPSFFQQSETRSFLRRLLWRDRTGFEKDFKLDAPTRASLEKISDVLSKGDLQAPDYADIRRETEKILEIHYPKA